MLGRFHEISIATPDIRASVEFYERLGFTHAETGDTFTHPYGVLTDGRIFLGLHEHTLDSPALTFVHAGIAQQAVQLRSRHLKLAYEHTGNEIFNSLGFRDPAGLMVRLLEARTYSPVARPPQRTSLCGYFAEFSMPSTNFAAAKDFWEPLGFVAAEESDVPYRHLTLTSDHLDLAFHQARTLDRPMLVFREPDMRERIARLRDLGIGDRRDAPQGLDAERTALIEAPEGTPLLLLEEES